MYMKDSNKLFDLTEKINVQYGLLEKLPLGISFYETYSNYRELADKIAEILEIGCVPGGNNLSTRSRDSIESYRDYVSLKIIPVIYALKKNKNIFLKRLPENADGAFDFLIFHFAKLAKLQGDIRFDDWYAKTESVFTDFLAQIDENGDKSHFSHKHVL